MLTLQVVFLAIAMAAAWLFGDERLLVTVSCLAFGILLITKAVCAKHAKNEEDFLMEDFRWSQREIRYGRLCWISGLFAVFIIVRRLFLLDHAGSQRATIAAAMTIAGFALLLALARKSRRQST